MQTISKEAVLAGLNFKAYFAKEIESFRANGNSQALGLCPFHADREPSFSVNIDSGLCKCFGCNFEGDVFSFHGRKYDLSFQDSLKELADLAGIKEPGKRKIVATYPYTDETGTLLFEVVRTDPKGFLQRRPDEKGGWIWNLDGIMTTLFNLPEVTKADAVYVVEGEKDVESLKQIGVIATTNPQGAGKWKTHYNSYLAGKSVVVMADNDEPGRRHAEDVARNLKGIARTVKVVTLPVLPDKGDVSDWISAGGTKETLLQIVENTPEWQAPEPETPFVKPSYFYNRDESYEPEYLVDGLILAKSITCLAGSPGSMKSWLMQGLLVSLASGSTFLGRITKKSKFFYFDRENPEDLWFQRLVRYFRTRVPDDLVEIWPFWKHPAPPKFLDSVYLDLVKNNPGGVFVFDSYSKFLPKGYSENTNENAADVTNFLRELTAYGATIILIHHAGKDNTNGVRGAEEILAGVDVAYTLSKNDNRLTLKSIKNRFTQDSTILIDVKTDIDGYIFFEDASEEERNKKDLVRKAQVKTACQIILDHQRAGKPTTKKEIAAELMKGLTVGNHTARQVIEWGLKRNILSYCSTSKQLGVVDVMTPKGGSSSSSTDPSTDPLLNQQSTTGYSNRDTTTRNQTKNTDVDWVNQQRSTTAYDGFIPEIDEEGL